jgi:hypothetical protein
MKDQEFQELVDVNKYQVFLFTCPVTIPLNFAVHPWIVTNRVGEIDRWEVWQDADQCETSYSHVHRNLLDLSQGVRKWPYGNSRFDSKLIGKIEGDVNSIADRMSNFIEVTSPRYHHREKYRLLGPNSNTFVQWILDEYPRSNLRLPVNAIGKGYTK